MGEFICSYLQLFAVRGTYLYIKSKSFEMSRVSRHNKSFVKRDIEELTKALRKMKIEDDVHGRTGVKMAIIGCKRKGDNNDGHGVIKRKITEEVKEFHRTVQHEDDEKPVKKRDNETSVKMEVTGRKRRSNESDECRKVKKKISEKEKKVINVLKKLCCLSESKRWR